MAETLVCTIVTKSHLAYARALAVSLAEHNPGLELYVLLADRNEGDFDPDQEPFHLIPLEALSDQAAVQRMCFYYTPFELCCALRGLLHEYILSHTTAERWIFLDSDIYVCGTLEPVFERLRSATILLTPHRFTPPAIDQAEAFEIENLLPCGLYNAGFLGLRRCETTRQFLEWWIPRLERYCFNDAANQHPRGLFVDQLWLNFVPIYFPEVVCLDDRGCNVGHWNLWARPLTLSEDGLILAGGDLLRFIHFSGWSLEEPERVSRYSPSYEDADQPLWAKLGRLYRDLLLAQGHEICRHWSYAFSRFTTGDLITPEMRLLYYEDWQAGGVGAEVPFSQPEIFQDRSPVLVTGVQLRIRLAELSNYSEHLLHENHHFRATLEQHQQQLAQSQQQFAQSQQQLAQSQQQLQIATDELEQSQQQLAQSQQQLQIATDELEQFRQKTEVFLERIRFMEQSRFWKLRQLWQRFKRRVGLKTDLSDR